MAVKRNRPNYRNGENGNYCEVCRWCRQHPKRDGEKVKFRCTGAVPTVVVGRFKICDRFRLK